MECGRRALWVAVYVGAQGPELSLTLHFHGLEILNNFLARGLAFHFSLGRSRVVVWDWTGEGRAVFLLKPHGP